MDPTSRGAHRRTTGTGTNPFSILGYSLDLNDPIAVCEEALQEIHKLNRTNTLLNILRHLLLIPNGTPALA
jgi:hypothetical protein